MKKDTIHTVEKFKLECCPNCILKGRCIEEGKNDEWFEMCPHFFNWKIGYVSPLIERANRAERERLEHPEEYEKKMKIYEEKIKELKKNKKKKIIKKNK